MKLYGNDHICTRSIFRAENAGRDMHTAENLNRKLEQMAPFSDVESNTCCPMDALYTFDSLYSSQLDKHQQKIKRTIFTHT